MFATLLQSCRFVASRVLHPFFDRLPGLRRQFAIVAADVLDLFLVELLQIQQRVVAPSIARISSSSFVWIAPVSRFCVF